MNLLFDYDGTLHDSSATYLPAFKKTLAWLEDNGYDVGREYSDEQIGYWLGFSAKDMWNSFAPELDDAVKETCSKMIGAEMRRLTEAGKARLYPGIPATLERLKADGHRLFFVSNCHHSYMQMHRKAFDLDRFFTDFYCCEDYGWIPKADLFPTIQQAWGTGIAAHDDFMIIGDRFHDMNMAREHGIRSVGCAYGFGTRDEIADADAIAETPSDLYGAIARAAA